MCLTASAPSLGRRSRSGSSFLLSRARRRLSRFELGTVPAHGVHDDGERDPRLSEGGPPGYRQCPVLRLKRFLVARQHDVRGLVEQGSHPAVAPFGAAAGVVDLAGLIAARHQTQVGLTMRHDAIDAMASFRFSAGIARRWHNPAELPLHKLSKSDGCAVL